MRVKVTIFLSGDCVRGSHTHKCRLVMVAARWHEPLAFRTAGSYVLPLRQTWLQTKRLASARRAPLLQFKQSMGIAVLHKGSEPARRVRPVSSRKLNLPLSRAGITSWSRMALRRQSYVFHPWRCAHQQPSVAYSPPTQPLQRRGPLLTSHLFGSARPKRQIGRLQSNMPRTTAFYGEQTTSKSPSGQGPLKQNQGKIWCSTPAGLQIVSTPARFWDRGVRCFVGRFSLGRWMGLHRLLADRRLGVTILQERYRRIIYAVRIAVDRCFSAARLV